MLARMTRPSVHHDVVPNGNEIADSDEMGVHNETFRLAVRVGNLLNFLCWTGDGMSDSRA